MDNKLYLRVKNEEMYLKVYLHGRKSTSLQKDKL